MKRHYTFSTGESIEADLDDLRRLLEENRRYLENYTDVLGSLEDDDYVARGNGFCDRKYSDDFIESQIEKYEKRVKEIEGWIILSTDGSASQTAQERPTNRCCATPSLP